MHRMDLWLQSCMYVHAKYLLHLLPHTMHGHNIIATRKHTRLNTGRSNVNHTDHTPCAHKQTTHEAYTHAHMYARMQVFNIRSIQNTSTLAGTSWEQPQPQGAPQEGCLPH